MLGSAVRASGRPSIERDKQGQHDGNEKHEGRYGRWPLPCPVQSDDPRYG